jgi:hydroxymethylpyrimidine pyrophosphatase-like HAD family hydrolase
MDVPVSARPRGARAVRFRALATDYDGTIAHDGYVDDNTVAALRRVRDAGLLLIMVTGRELTDLFDTFEHVGLFHRVVAENGAVIYEPATQAIEVLAAAPPRALIDRLTRERIPLSVGHSVVATVKPHERAVLAAIHDLELDWHVVFNKGSAMALPADAHG